MPPGRDQRGDVLPLEEEVRSLGGTEIRELRQLREENAKLDRLVADLSLDKHILTEVIRKSLKPARKRALVEWTQRSTPQVSPARVGWRRSHARCALIAAVVPARRRYGIGLFHLALKAFQLTLQL